MVATVVDIPSRGPAREQRGSHRLETDLGGNQRVLAQLLGTDQQSAAMDESRRQDGSLRRPHRVATHQVEGAEVLQLVFVELKVGTLAEAIGHHAMGLDPDRCQL